jgi:hypothetical protein
MLKRFKPWRVVFVTRIFDSEPREIGRRWTEGGAWRFAYRLLTPHGGWYEVRRTSDDGPSKLTALDRLEVEWAQQRPQSDHDAAVRRGDD